MSKTIKEVAKLFCSALDSGDWDAVTALLSSDCAYHFRGGQMTGVEEIVGSYRTIDEWVRETFEGLLYESKVELKPDGSALITFRDRMSLGEHHLDFRCQQLIELDDAGLIGSITHIDIEGEPEKAARFNEACGVVKPS